MPYMIVSEVARAIQGATGESVNPRDISTLFYQRALRDDLCPIVGGRRMVPADYVPQVENALRRAGKLPRREATPCN